MNKKLIYIANARIPTEKAHGVQIAQMCEAFAKYGLDVELVVPWRFNKIKQDIFEYYDVEKSFKITKLPCFDLVSFGKIGFWIQSFSFAKIVAFYVLFKKADIIYSRDYLSLFFLSFFRRDIFWEVHMARYNFFIKRVIKKCKKVICISRGLKSLYVGKGVNEKIFLIAPDAVDINKFKIKNSKLKIRQDFELSEDKILVGYVGMLKTMGERKGIDIALESLKLLDKNIDLVLVGGENNDINYYKELSKKLGVEERVIFVGRVEHKLIPLYLKSFDVLIAPFPKTKHYKYYMSPMKIFEYMASGVPIVASNLTSLREVLNFENAVLVEPDLTFSLVGGINKLLGNKEFAQKISNQAMKDAENYTWDKRVERILNFMSS